MDTTKTAEDAKLDWIDGDMPYSTLFGDHFYCRSDGRAECGHVFVGANGLPGRWADGGAFAIGELGFGTGLNFCETLRIWRAPRAAGQAPGTLSFTSFELYPMEREAIAKALSRWPELTRERGDLLALWPEKPDSDVTLTFEPDVTLRVIVGDALDRLSARKNLFDAWYLDGFAPSRNPAMWSEELMAAVCDHTSPGGTFATYAAAGFVRRNLMAAGFAVERRPGFAGKREMLAGTKSAA
ncbi:tRNA U34 5-methylaminomethyl-2-thiouridine-forming methyltransferase MnmC [Rhizobium sp. SG_E_25_P2]|uniref:tRNA (5-methylaminomethyl-2-thiouridine)(34)-methyltransferase MnmD n=1 Tax=Rhizobium sp. SG_E_25_P2 TaxID=2879942 RepID=UPI002473D806|nr:tRNA (5-methylaminomethyl-2-thiouridine)(34)-methyltransferase MnmD [Rhizobium sp. SG_E_25_P2]MDH6269155.1 tRNA U34 5-methylaminomethyl-2-thiouridine-forming methyltransferase MnmC [Rhizobium sp. SG_E_25_P2]